MILTWGTDRANEANKMFITWLCWLFREENEIIWRFHKCRVPYGYLRTDLKLTNHSVQNQSAIIIIVSYERPKSAQRSFIFCSFTLSEFTVSSLGKDGSSVSHSVKVQMDQRIRRKMLISLGNAGKLESPASDRTGQPCYVILFCSSCVIHHDWNSEFTWISKLRVWCRSFYLLVYISIFQIFNK